MSADVSLPAAVDAPRAAQRWLVGPWFDALFIANLAWPLVVLIQLDEGFGGTESVKFWQLYFITTPHRWITLVIVFLDGARLNERRGTFIGLALAAIVLCAAVRLTTGALTCLMAIDYVWNAWHFASQHHGILSIYGRMGDAAPRVGLAIEKWAMRMFLLYVILRIVSATWPDVEWNDAFSRLDWIAAIVPVGLLAWALVRWRRNPVGRFVYLVSVLGLYGALLWVVHEHRISLVLPLATASALFHAVEYLALVGWSVRQRHSTIGGQMGMLAYFVPRWEIALVFFIVILGAGAWLMDQGLMDAWLAINVVVAFLHYTYDGMIWRRRAAT